MIYVHFRRSVGVLLLSLLSLAVHAADLTVSAAASLTNAFKELGPVFEAQNPGTAVVLNFAASDALLAQIVKGAPADIFASADQEAMDRADAQKLLVAGSRRNFVSNSLVLIVPSDSALGVKVMADLQKAEVKRIAIGNPHLTLRFKVDAQRPRQIADRRPIGFGCGGCNQERIKIDI